MHVQVDGDEAPLRAWQLVARAHARRDDRGAIPALGVLVFLGVGVLTLVGVGIYVFNENTGPNSGGFTVTIENASVKRQPDDLVVVTVDLLVDFQSDVAAAALSFLPVAQCTMRQEQTSGPRTLTGVPVEVPAGAGSTRVRRVQATIQPGADNKAIQGEFEVACVLVRDNSTLYTSSVVTIDVPPPRGATADTTFTGDYELDAVTSSGGECESKTFVIHVEQTVSTAVKISFDGGTFEAELSSSWRFTGVAGGRRWQGLFFIGTDNVAYMRVNIDYLTESGTECLVAYEGKRKQ